MHGGEEGCLRHVGGETREKNTPFGRSRRRRGNNIKMDLMEFFSWINLAHNTVM